MKRTIFTVVLIFVSIFGATASDNFEFTPAVVMDISDRRYEGAVIKLLDGAEKSIVISMYVVSLGPEGNNPMRLLLNDLFEARARGVSVTLYLNTHFKGAGDPRERLGQNETLKKLRDSGCVVHLLPPHRMLHDKLIVVDSRYIVEGSANWSISALRDNYESTTLIDSPGLAGFKLARLKVIENGELRKPGEIHAPLYINDLPQKFNIPAKFVTDKRYLSLMVSRSDERSIRLFLILLALKDKTHNAEVFIDLESMALSLGMPSGWSDTDLRRQVIRSIKKLENSYGLIKADFFFGKDARIEIKDTGSGGFSIGNEVFSPRLGAPAIFYLIAKAYLESSGEDITKIQDKSLAQRFGLYSTTIATAKKQITSGSK